MTMFRCVKCKREWPEMICEGHLVCDDCHVETEAAYRPPVALKEIRFVIQIGETVEVKS
jgi:DNA-directed RNA polymerase subunit RPC12/RpoP